MTTEGGKEEVSPPEPGNSTSVEVTKLLEPFTNYSFYVRVWNNYGASDQSATIVCSTAPSGSYFCLFLLTLSHKMLLETAILLSVPKGTPKMNVDIISSTKLNVSWEPLSKKESRGVVVQYKLLWKLHQSSSSRWVHYLPASVEYYVLSGMIFVYCFYLFEFYENNQSRIIDTGLEPGARYDLRVLARTKQGEPNISEAQLDWITVTMPSSESNQFTIRNVVDIQVLIVNASIIKVSISLIKLQNFHVFRIAF